MKEFNINSSVYQQLSILIYNFGNRDLIDIKNIKKRYKINYVHTYKTFVQYFKN